jgi:8-oxo-dGTP diphosphatase
MNSGERVAMRVVAGILRDGAGRVLLAKRPTGKPHEGLWEFPGGKVEPGESDHEALRRELSEELGITVEVSGFFHRTLWHYPRMAWS